MLMNTIEESRFLHLDRKKIMFFIYRMGGGGAARTILNIVNHLDRQQFQPILVTLDFNYTYEHDVRDDVTFIKLPVKRLRQAIVPLMKLIRKEQPNLLFSTVPNYNTIAILAKLLSRTKTKLIVREAAYLGGTWNTNLKLKLYGLLYRFSDRVIALSNGVKDNLISRYHVPKEKISVIYNPVDIKHILTESEKEPEEPFLFREDKQTILTAGRLVKEKDHRTLFRAFAKLDDLENKQLIILGEGELEGELKQLAKELGIFEQVYFLGFKRNPYAYMKRADVFALTSITEGFGHVLVEALALGTLVVSTRCRPGAEEILGDGEFGLLADVGDSDMFSAKLAEALSLSEAEKVQLITKGKKRARDFAVELIVRQYEQVFLQVIDEKMRKL